MECSFVMRLVGTACSTVSCRETGHGVAGNGVDHPLLRPAGNGDGHSLPLTENGGRYPLLNPGNGEKHPLLEPRPARDGTAVDHAVLRQSARAGEV